MDDARPISNAEIEFFRKSGTGKGKHNIESHTRKILIPITVPVIAVFTKCEALEIKAINDLEEKGFSFDDAMKDAPDVVKKTLKAYFQILEKEKFPPKGHVYFQGELSLMTVCLTPYNQSQKSCTSLTNIVMNL
jgi:hypothetical protein